MEIFFIVYGLEIFLNTQKKSSWTWTQKKHEIKFNNRVKYGQQIAPLKNQIDESMSVIAFSLSLFRCDAVCDASKGCLKLVIYVQLNYFKLDLIIRSFLRVALAFIELSVEWLNRMDSVYIRRLQRVSPNDVDDDVQFKGFKIWFFSKHPTRASESEFSI